MGLSDIISGLLRTIGNESRVLPRDVESRDVIGEMTKKYGTVDMSPTDISIIGDDIKRRDKELRRHRDVKPSDRSRCKATEDVYNTRDAKLRSDLCLLNTLYKRVVASEINKFPMNKVCTIKYIADYIGVKESVVWYTLVVDNDVSAYLYCNDRYNINVKCVSDTEIHIRVFPGRDYSGYSYMCDDEKIRVHNMILPNWRFVKSTDSSIFYMERIS